MNKRNTIINLITIIFLIVQILMILGLLKNGRVNYVYEVIVISVLFLVYTFWEIKRGLYLNNYIRFVVILTLLAHVIIGDYLDFYSTSVIFDKGLHGFGTYSFTLFIYGIISELTTNNKISKVYDFIFVIALGMALGQLFEFLEFAIDLTAKPTPPGQNGLFDTDIDMILNTLGAIVAAFHITFSKQKLFKNKMNSF